MEGSTETNRQSCEVYSRVVGYIRPTEQWNPGKQAEFSDRRTFAVSDQSVISQCKEE